MTSLDIEVIQPMSDKDTDCQDEEEEVAEFTCTASERVIFTPTSCQDLLPVYLMSMKRNV